MPVSAQIDVLVADIGGTNCRFQVWALDSFFRPSRMVVEKVGAAACRRCRRRLPLAAAPAPLPPPHPVCLRLPAPPQFYATKDYAHFRDALAELLKLPELR